MAIIRLNDIQSVKKNFYQADDIEDVVFEISYYTSHIHVYTLSTSETYAELTKVYKHDPAIIEEYNFYSLLEVQELFNTLLRVVYNWKSTYKKASHQNNAMFWNLAIKYKDGFVAKYEGDGAYPNNFEDLLDLFGIEGIK